MKAFNRKRNIITSCSYDTANTLSCLSQNQQLFCSAFVYEHVVFFTTGMGTRNIFSSQSTIDFCPQVLQ